MRKRGYSSRRSLRERGDDVLESVRRWLQELPLPLAVLLVALFAVAGLSIIGVAIYFYHPALF